MLIGNGHFCIQSRMILYVIADDKSGIGEIGVHTYGETPLIKIQVDPSIAKTVMEAWIKEETEENEANPIRQRRRITRKRKPAKRGVKK